MPKCCSSCDITPGKSTVSGSAAKLRISATLASSKAVPLSCNAKRLYLEHASTNKGVNSWKCTAQIGLNSPPVTIGGDVEEGAHVVSDKFVPSSQGHAKVFL